MSNEPQPSHLSNMIDCITDRNSQKQPSPQKTANIQNLYSEANTMITKFDNTISRCKKYNQAKINRKYEIIINDLQAEVKRLQENLKLQQDARSPTKKHISDILEKLVEMRSENQSLKVQNNSLQSKIRSLEGEIDTQNGAFLRLQSQQAKATVQRLPSINPNGTLAQTVKEFLKDKEQVRRIRRIPVSNLQKFLSQTKPKLWNMNIADLLGQIDRWGEGIKQRSGSEVDMWRIRSSIARKFSDYVDHPSNLTKPSLLDKSFDSSKVQSYYRPQKKLKFSYLGSKRSLNSSVQ